MHTGHTKHLNRDVITSRRHLRCVICGGDAILFSDNLSETEYTISGMCQLCQDEIFIPDATAYTPVHELSA
jgi:hypothetical protein